MTSALRGGVFVHPVRSENQNRRTPVADLRFEQGLGDRARGGRENRLDL